MTAAEIGIMKHRLDLLERLKDEVAEYLMDRPELYGLSLHKAWLVADGAIPAGRRKKK